ncbi:MAG: hypothetical protein F6K11_08510 [Leptolyngbya sp. SIO3F4]|nr:hypothetical protein [Leptolyngbya sp. SIO3F4]
MQTTMKYMHAIAGIICGTLIFSSCNSQSMNKREEAIRNIERPKTLSEVKEYALGSWESLSIELRPTEDRVGSGEIQPTFLTRKFTYLEGDKFVGIITLFADNYGQAPLMEFEFKGNLNWGGEHPIAPGAWKVDYVLDEGFGVTPLNEQAAAMLNQALPEGMQAFEAGVQQDILEQAFPLFSIEEGQTVTDYDLIYFRNGLLFMGAKHVNGTPFDKPENRPHQLQIPLVRISE